jgi:hypothetical protein
MDPEEMKRVLKAFKESGDEGKKFTKYMRTMTPAKIQRLVMSPVFEEIREKGSKVKMDVGENVGRESKGYRKDVRNSEDWDNENLVGRYPVDFQGGEEEEGEEDEGKEGGRKKRFEEIIKNWKISKSTDPMMVNTMEKK